MDPRSRQSRCPHPPAIGPGGALLALLLAAAPLTAQTFDLPGTQPTTSSDPSITDLFDAAAGGGPFACSSCHQDSSQQAFPFDPWQGSMMAHAARDPLFYAQLDLANADHLLRPEVDGVGDLCLRCHSPVGWLEGRSSNPSDPSDHSGLSFIQKDVFGVQCHACHRLVDPLIGSKDPGHVDIANILGTLGTMPGDNFWPPTYGNGMYVMDPLHSRRGPYGLAELEDHTASVLEESPGVSWMDATLHFHPVMRSAFHREGDLCGTCHDVSNPADCGAFTNADTQKCFPIERTWSEWRHSAYYDSTLPGGGEAGSCQSCHMSGPLNGVNFGLPCVSGAVSNPFPHFSDVHYHDLTGGNLFVLEVLKDMKQRYDACAFDPGCAGAELDFKNAVDGLYPPAGSTPFDFVQVSALDAGIERVRRTLRRAAFLDVVSVTPSTLTVRVTNRTGHKLPTGYPEGRRMWLNVKFLGAGGSLLAESGRYNGDDPGDSSTDAALYHDQNLDATSGPLAYDVVAYTDAAGVELSLGRPTKVWEARPDYDPTGDCDTNPAVDCVEFHFALNNRYRMDNRIPPEGWDVTGYTDSRALPVIPPSYVTNGWQGDYGAGGGPILHHDDIAYERPSGVDRAVLTLYYQTASREYIEALDADNPGTLTVAGYDRGSLMLEEWQRVGRSKPVVMRRLVVALEDADMDGLSDGWEAAHGLDTSPDGGYNDDPDGDGYPNWQEFQLDTDPTPPAGGDDPEPGGMRDPVDLVLVLDKSGSMNGSAPGTTTPKIDVLRDSVTLLLEVWKEYAVAGDRLGIVWFDTNADPAPAGFALGGFAATLPAALADVATRSAGGWTAMGAGLYTALQGLAASSAAKHVILFSNGMQNRSPMIREDMAGNLVIRDQMVGDPDVTGGSNVTIGAADFAIPADVSIHTVGIGVAGTNSSGDGWHELLHELAAEHAGKHNFITQAYDLEGVFLEDLVEALRGSTLEYVDDEEWTLKRGETAVFEIPVNASATRFSAIVSWSGQTAPGPDLELVRPDGAVEDHARLTRSGGFYRIVTRHLSHVDEAPGEYGTWTLRITHRGERQDDEDRDGVEGALRVRAYGVLDDAELEYLIRVPGDGMRVEEPLRIAVAVSHGGRLLQTLDEVTVIVDSPGAAIGELLAKSRHRPEQATGLDPDAAAGPYTQKLQAALADPAFQKRLEPRQSVYVLEDDGTGGDSQAGNGLYERDLLVPRVPGLYRIHVRIRGTTPEGQTFVREETRSVVVGIGPIDAARSNIHRLVDGPPFALFRPTDRHGNLLGPGHRHQMTVLAAGEPVLVEDLLDGSYRATLPSAAAADDVRLVLDGEVFFDGALPSRPPLPSWLHWLLVLVLLLLAVLIFLRMRR